MEDISGGSRDRRRMRSSPSLPRRRPPGRSPSSRQRYDVTHSMDRLRASMIGSDTAAATDTDTSDAADDINITSLPPTTAWKCLGQIPAILLIGMFHLMIGIPFGVSYFPIGWKSGMEDTTTSHHHEDASSSNIDNEMLGPFPLPGKEALGIRMFLLSTIVGQLVFALRSGFVSPIGLQMVENVPFCHELVRIAIRHQGPTLEALATSLVLFGLSTLLVGVVFWVLGHFRLGNIVYYFPNHVLVGCIGGIGLYICKTGLEVTIDGLFSWTHLVQFWPLVGVVLVFESILRILEHGTRDPKTGQPRFALLSPIYFCLLPPVFYLCLRILGVTVAEATEAGYFFPPLDNNSSAGDAVAGGGSGLFGPDLYYIWTSVNFNVISWSAMKSALPTMLALILFSLIHVPINIPAFAISTRTEIDMNVELEAHGYANILAAIGGGGGGLPNYMAYTQSVLYTKSGGTGRISGLFVAAATGVLFVVGPTICSYIPRCMAGTLLVHVGLDLFLEGVYDSFGQFDWWEYAGIWLIALVMTFYGMEAAMIAGFVTALCTYAVQNTTYVHPLRGSMSASTLRSSKWNRSTRANELLASEDTGRNRVLMVQLQGHLFFGNAVVLTQSIREILQSKQGTGQEPWVVILDFGLVLGIDSSAGQSIGKLNTMLQKEFHINTCIFVTGSEEGFPTEYKLTKELSSAPKTLDADIENGVANENTGLLPNNDATQPNFVGSFVNESLDEALTLAEDALIALEDLALLEEDLHAGDSLVDRSHSIEEESRVALKYLTMLLPQGVDERSIKFLFSKFKREVHFPGDFVWRQGSKSDSTKLLVYGTLLAQLENEAGTREVVVAGNSIGEHGLVEGVPRMSSVTVISEEPAILYSLSRDSFDSMVRESPQVARLIDLILIRYLSARVQHVSNRIFETRCLPI